jgi:hypothetical protein
MDGRSNSNDIKQKLSHAYTIRLVRVVCAGAAAVNPSTNTLFECDEIISRFSCVPFLLLLRSNVRALVDEVVIVEKSPQQGE